MLSGARCARADLPLEPHAGGVRHRPRIPLSGDIATALPAALPAGCAERQGRAYRHFPGHQITPNLVQEVGNQFSTRIEGTCIKHHYGKSTVKMYDKFALVLRLETTTNNVSFFKHHRKVEHRHGRSTRQLAPVKKSIYSLRDLRDILLGCNQRYLAYLATLDDFSAGVRALNRITRPNPAKGKSVKPVNFFSSIDQNLLRALHRPAFNISGMRRAGKRGKSGGGMIIIFPRRRASDSVGECRRRTILTAFRLPS